MSPIPPVSNGIKELFTKGGLKMFVDWLNDLFNADGRPKHLTDVDAPNDMEYFSTTTSKMTYKDSIGITHTYY